ncbi:glycosyltransferase family 4 protein [Francisella tularensis]|uniref:glycosyltransferase family 4 protein n=1 Tax=Francisella tularensis TaxID=263 RepID=UPI000C77750A|nr:glycosyltransferase family 1 protein [Francisella tularensis]MDE4941365.1 glycosyltransferase family 4 protein [Francisella tularensis subsp. holarctica]MDE4972798.1 glycosyltransferase family 4 protein [Francisella tularensis subsp. holarctica]MWY89950.1 glycosyltransferase family 4 protein [Francisella tularensis]PLQ33464.1 glycosyltransferase family 1 protein [Francisella tularensis subsp. holarctica]PLQ38152.1 glycosyltransferase family 1 protein [Francisella tularensis subsp. holarctic
MSKLSIDTRWQGKHGIGRYACEIIKYLPQNFITTSKHIKPFSLKDLFYLSFLIRKKDVLGYYTFAANVPLPIFLRANKPIIITIHDLIPIISKYESNFIKKLYFEKILKPLIKRENVKIMTVSNFSKNQILEWSGIDSSKVIVAYNGISTAFDYKPTTVKQKFFLYIGNRRPHKNIEIIFKAFKNFKYYDEYNLVFSGEMDHQLLNYAKKYNVCLSKIQTIGLDANDELLAKYYQSATATILPSFEEGFGLPLVESMACGTPVLASKIEVLQEIAAQAGLYFDPYSADELYSNIQKLIDDKELYNQKVELSLVRAKQFNWDQTANIVQDELKKLNLL